MAEAIGTASAIIQVVAACLQICQITTQLADQIKNAPKHIAAFRNDTTSFYAILGTLQSYLDHEDTAGGILHSTTRNDVQDVLQNCIGIFQQFQYILGDYLKSTSAVVPTPTWQRVTWTWKEKEVLQLRDQLSAHKITLNVAIATANMSVSASQSLS
jgi:hypothetical protein